MRPKRITGITVSSQRVSALKAFLLSSGNREPFDDPDIASECAAVPADLFLSSQEHCPDDVFVGYALGTLSEETRERVEQHLRLCPLCAEEVQRMQQISRAWEPPRTLSRIQQRIRSGRKHEPLLVVPPLPFAPLPTSMGALLAKNVAYSQGENDQHTVATVHFPIVGENGQSIAELRGTVERHQSDYFARVDTHSPDAERDDLFAADTVLLTIRNQENILLQRRLDVGVTTLLGTDLPLTENSHIEGLLLAEGPRATSEESAPGAR